MTPSPPIGDFTRADLVGQVGVWRFASATDATAASAIEDAGFASIWLGGGPDPTLRDAEHALRATQRVTVATGIVVIWRATPRSLTDAYFRLLDRYGRRFLLGLGTGHSTRIGPHDEPPYSAMVRYLDELEEAGVPLRRVVIAALGPRMLRLAAERTAGAHPYLVDPAYTTRAREALGTAPLLIPEQRVVLGADREAARAAARRSLGMYLGLANYRRNFERSGFNERDLTPPGTKRLIDALTGYEADDSIRHRTAAHLAAGADQVLLQLIGPPAEDPARAYPLLARAAGALG
jgi:probable F420-dependent oxidoreductase